MEFGNKFPKSPILEALEGGEKGVDELVRILKIPVSELLEEILALELEGFIEEKNGKYLRIL